MFDPNDLTVAELREELSTNRLRRSRDDLRAMRKLEAEGKSRKTALALIERELKRAQDRRDNLGFCGGCLVVGSLALGIGLWLFGAFKSPLERAQDSLEAEQWATSIEWASEVAPDESDYERSRLLIDSAAAQFLRESVGSNDWGSAKQAIQHISESRWSELQVPAIMERGELLVEGEARYAQVQANVRKGPSTAYEVIRSVPVGMELKAVPVNQHWSLLVQGTLSKLDTIGYIHSSLLAANPPQDSTAKRSSDDAQVSGPTRHPRALVGAWYNPSSGSGLVFYPNGDLEWIYGNTERLGSWEVIETDLCTRIPGNSACESYRIVGGSPRTLRYGGALFAEVQ